VHPDGDLSGEFDEKAFDFCTLPCGRARNYSWLLATFSFQPLFIVVLFDLYFFVLPECKANRLANHLS